MHRYTPDQLARRQRNSKLYDRWSFIHIISGMVFAWVLPLWLAVALLALYEPLEVFVLSPICARFGISFGYEALVNSLSDIFFDFVGLGLGYALIALLR